jgi:type III secretion HrpO family protein
MTPETVNQAALEALMMILQFSAPLVGAAAVIGLLFGFLQAITQLQDQTTVFAIKLVAVMALLVVLMPWLGVQLNTYGERMFEMVIKVKV